MSSPEMRVDGPHHLLDFHVERTHDGLLVSARIDPTATCSEAEVRKIIAQIRELSLVLEHLQAEGSTETYRRTVLMNRDPNQTPDRADPATDEGPFAEDEAIEWEDLIPEPPARPSGRIPVRLTKAGRDKPLPAENPWAE